MTRKNAQASLSNLMMKVVAIAMAPLALLVLLTAVFDPQMFASPWVQASGVLAAILGSLLADVVLKEWLRD